MPLPLGSAGDSWVGSRPGLPSRAGFSLLELVVVLLILVLLAGTLAPMYGSRIERAREARCSTELKVIAEAFNLYYEDVRAWPHDADLAPRALANETRPLERYECLYTNVFSKGTWEGPYLAKSYKPSSSANARVCGASPDQGFRDPWGRPYQVVYAAVGSSSAPFGAIAVLTAGPNGTIESTTAQLANAQTGGDDQALLVTNRL
jgi:prepilin-type N-terminal cleavage/methylation domain-containing protein